mmetsp:Transcript_135003/g.431315  ORF Transcript_135003/g.431315 Transcript_135003/m.431315 type:complete len:835 (-) Transcript_135003:123-2627(-)
MVSSAAELSNLSPDFAVGGSALVLSPKNGSVARAALAPGTEQQDTPRRRLAIGRTPGDASVEGGSKAPCDGAVAPSPSQPAGAVASDGAGVGLVYDERMTKHYNLLDDGHPERPARIVRIFESLEEAGLADRCVRIPCRAATREELLLKHTEKHVDTMLNIETLTEEEATELGERYKSVYLCPGSAQAGLLAAGSVIEGVAAVCRGDVGRSICVVRPPGHHAECECAMGFCMFGNVSLAVAEAQRTCLSKRTLIVDWDVHHGNGTQNMFDDDSAVLFFSVHRYDTGRFFPGGELGHFESHGKGEGAGYSVNVPWDVRGGFKKGHPAPGDAEYLEAFEKLLLPIAADFQPDLVVVSSGFDAAAGDPLGECEVTPAGYHALTRMLLSLAGGRVVVVLEGGYNLESISNSMVACTRALFGDPMPPPASEAGTGDGEAGPAPPAHHFHAETVERVRAHLAPLWPSLRAPGEEVVAQASELRVPAAALRGTIAEMERALREHAESDESYERLRRRQQAVLFQLEEVPPDPPQVKSQEGWSTLRLSFDGSTAGPPYLLAMLHVLTPEQVVQSIGYALQAAMAMLGVQRASLKGPSGGASGKAGKAQLEALAECFGAARQAYPRAWLGVSLPQLPAAQVFKWLMSHCPTANAVWLHQLACKPADVTWESSVDASGGGQPQQPQALAVRLEKWLTDHQPALKGVVRERQIASWKGLVIGSVAIQGQDRVHHAQDDDGMGDACQTLLRHWVTIASSVCDVVATGSPDPGRACAVAKLKAMGGVTPVALTSSGCQGEDVGAAGCVDVAIADGRALAGGATAEEGKLFEFDIEQLRAWVSRWRDA